MSVCGCSELYAEHAPEAQTVNRKEGKFAVAMFANELKVPKSLNARCPRAAVVC